MVLWAVGMYGKSWGGFNGLQVAAHRPPALRAVISAYFTDDRYADDVHYMGGCVLGHESLSWASYMLGLNALPPDPEIVGERWREMWMERLSARRSSSRSGCDTSAVTSSGSRARSARTMGPCGADPARRRLGRRLHERCRPDPTGL